MMVDGAVVMMENIFKHLSHPDQRHDAEVAARVSADDQDPTTLPTIATSACASRKRRGEAGCRCSSPSPSSWWCSPLLFSLEGVEAAVPAHGGKHSVRHGRLAGGVADRRAGPGELSVPAWRRQNQPAGGGAGKGLPPHPDRGHGSQALGAGGGGLLVAALALLPYLGTEFVPNWNWKALSTCGPRWRPRPAWIRRWKSRPKLEAMLDGVPGGHLRAVAYRPCRDRRRPGAR